MLLLWQWWFLKARIWCIIQLISYISWTILVVVCCMCRTEAARSATVTVCSYPPPTAASCSCSPLNGRWLSLVQCLPGRPSCDTVSPITHSVPFYKLLHSVNSQLLSLVINKFGFKTSLRSSLILKDSQLELLKEVKQSHWLSFSPPFIFLVFQSWKNLVVYPGCCIPVSRALLFSTLYALAVKGQRWILWDSEERNRRVLSSSWACTRQCKPEKAKICSAFAFSDLSKRHWNNLSLLHSSSTLHIFVLALITCDIKLKKSKGYKFRKARFCLGIFHIEL